MNSNIIRSLSMPISLMCMSGGPVSVWVGGFGGGFRTYLGRTHGSKSLEFSIFLSIYSLVFSFELAIKSYKT